MGEGPGAVHVSRRPRKWVIAFACGLLGGGLAGGLAWLLAPVPYEAFALLKISRTPPSVLGSAEESNDEFTIFKRTQVELVETCSTSRIE
jgi:hypothetical protein